MLVLGIDIAAAKAGHNVDKVQFNHTRDVTPVGDAVGTLFGALVDDFEIDTRSQGHLVLARTIVAVALAGMGLLPLEIGSSAVGLISRTCFHIGGTHIGELHIAGEVAEVVHHAVDAKVVAMKLILIGRVTAVQRRGTVKRNLAHTVDGVVGVVGLLGHTVAGTLKHHTAAPNAHEVGTLEGVQQTTGIDGAEAGFYPIGCIVITYTRTSTIEEIVVLFRCQLSTWIIILSILVGTMGLTFEFQLEIGTFAVVQFMIFLNGDVVRETIEVGTIVADGQFAEAIDEGEVAVAIETADMLRTDGDEVAVIDVAQGCRDIAEDGVGVDEYLVTTHRHVTAGKDGIVDVDTCDVQFVPLSSICRLVLQGVQIVHGDIFALSKVTGAAALLVIV